MPLYQIIRRNSPLSPQSLNLSLLANIFSTFTFDQFFFSFILRIGFLGLGLMGSGIVSNLLKMGHVVTVWNRTAEKVQNKGFITHADGACQKGSWCHKRLCISKPNHKPLIYKKLLWCRLLCTVREQKRELWLIHHDMSSHNAMAILQFLAKEKKQTRAMPLFSRPGSVMCFPRVSLRVTGLDMNGIKGGHDVRAVQDAERIILRVYAGVAEKAVIMR